MSDVNYRPAIIDSHSFLVIGEKDSVPGHPDGGIDAPPSADVLSPAEEVVGPEVAPVPVPSQPERPSGSDFPAMVAAPPVTVGVAVAPQTQPAPLSPGIGEDDIVSLVSLVQSGVQLGLDVYALKHLAGSADMATLAIAGRSPKQVLDSAIGNLITASLHVNSLRKAFSR